jgi:glycosyltransferase involved in cell wall biosynthesis
MNKQSPAPVSVCLFFTYGISLKKWDELGLFDREVLLYKNLVAQGVKVSFFTYGDREDLAYSGRLPGINIIPAYAGFKKPKNNKLAFLQSLLFAFRFRQLYAQYDIYKTNQMFGAWVPLMAKFLNRKRLLARCGYEHYFTLITERRSFAEKLFFYLFSKLVYFFSDHIIVTSAWISHYVSRKFLVFKNKISVLPNHVDIELFKALPAPVLNDRILFVGRLNREKNLFSLIEACQRSGLGLDLVGQGNLKDELAEKAREMGADVRFLGVFPNNELPAIIAQYPIFILPSFYEGNPKVLLEAMSCGKAVIGANVDGISNIVKDGENGMLCGTSVDEIIGAISKVRNNAGLQKRLGEQARRYILEHHSADRILAQELNVYRQVAN